MIITAVFLTDPMKKNEQDKIQTAEARYSLIIEDLNKFVSYRLSDDSIEVEMHDPIVHACDRHPSLVPQGLVMEEDKDEKYVLFFLLVDLCNFMKDSKIQYSDVTVKDLDSDGDYEIICQELTRWGDGLEQIAELTLNYDKECKLFIEKREIIVPAEELPPDYSRYDIEVVIPEDIKEIIKEIIEKKAIE